MNIRGIALKILLRTAENGSYSNLSLDSAIKKYNPEPRDRALLTQLVMGVIEKQTTLDYFISGLSDIDYDKIEPEVRIILRLGLYQLMYTDRIPSHAAVMETVGIAPKRAKGFVNAILRGYIRKADSINLPDRKTDLPGYISVRYSFPLPVCRRFIDEFGAVHTESIFECMNRHRGLTLRVNTLKISREEMLVKLKDAGIEASPTVLSDNGIVISGSSVTGLTGFDEGYFFVQDEASQLCSTALGVESGMNVIDVCAAPGSKSFGAAADMRNEGRIMSFDLHKNKLSLIESGAKRLGIDIISTECRDGRNPDSALLESADRIICDVPCSGYGVMAKKPEIRHKNPADSSGLPQIQYDILSNSSKYLRHGGDLVYSTCTLLKAENDDVVEKFLAENPDFSLFPFRAGSLEVKEGKITLFPDIHSTDGFFIARLHRS